VDLHQVNKRVIESLILCGAFDSLGVFRSQLIAVLDQCIESVQADKKDRESQLAGQVSLLDILQEPQQQEQCELPAIDEYGKGELLAKEKETLGFYVSGHPLDGYEKLIARKTKSRIGELSRYRDREKVRIGGIVTACKRGTTRKGKGVIYLTVEDKGGSVDVIFFPPSNLEEISFLREDVLVLVEGRLSVQDDSYRIFGERIKPLELMPVEPEYYFYIRITPWSTGGLWKAIPIPFFALSATDREEMSCPLKNILPLVIWYLVKPITAPNKVDLPEPLGPKST
jgi:DNA polymerase-3 subunit alpha